MHDQADTGNNLELRALITAGHTFTRTAAGFCLGALYGDDIAYGITYTDQDFSCIDARLPAIMSYIAPHQGQHVTPVILQATLAVWSGQYQSITTALDTSGDKHIKVAQFLDMDYDRNWSVVEIRFHQYSEKTTDAGLPYYYNNLYQNVRLTKQALDAACPGWEHRYLMAEVLGETGEDLVNAALLQHHGSPLAVDASIDFYSEQLPDKR